jgi:putative mRNA 3-end processing factor
LHTDLLKWTPSGLYCEPGGFFIDPWRPVERAVITHAHSDHARFGSNRYLCASDSEQLLRLRLGASICLETLPYGKEITLGGVRVSLHPAGHVLGSAQIKIEKEGYTAVVSGDYKRQPDPTCEAYEPIRCNLFVTESTFGLPVFRWSPSESVADEIVEWKKRNEASGRSSLLFAYSLGKAQRLMGLLGDRCGPIYLHGAMEAITDAYRVAGRSLPPSLPVRDAPAGTCWKEGIIFAPPSAQGSPWIRRFGETSSAVASGWMAIRGTRRRRAVDRGFVLSDHVDWAGLLQTIRETEAESVWVTHGFSNIVVRYLSEQGVDARTLETQFVGESPESREDA